MYVFRRGQDRLRGPCVPPSPEIGHKILIYGLHLPRDFSLTCHFCQQESFGARKALAKSRYDCASVYCGFTSSSILAAQSLCAQRLVFESLTGGSHWELFLERSLTYNILFNYPSIVSKLCTPNVSDVIYDGEKFDRDSRIFGWNNEGITVLGLTRWVGAQCLWNVRWKGMYTRYNASGMFVES